MLDDKREKTFKAWLDDHKNLIFKVVRAYAAVPHDQDDLFQEILLHLWSSIPNFNGQAKDTTWIYRVALNTALIWKRDEKKKRKRSRRLTIDFDELSDVTQSSPDAVNDRQILEHLYAAIRKLPKIDASIILMYLDRLAYNDMAQILGITPTNVGVRLNRAKKQLAVLLKGLIDDL